MRLEIPSYNIDRARREREGEFRIVDPDGYVVMVAGP
jgi:hypothetical protein